MTRQDLIEKEKQIMELVVTQRKLGDYSADSAKVRQLAELLLDVFQHLRERAPREGKK